MSHDSLAAFISQGISSLPPSEYGRVIYTKPSDDPRIFIPVPRGTKAFRDAFKIRTCLERVNDRV